MYRIIAIITGTGNVYLIGLVPKVNTSQAGLCQMHVDWSPLGGTGDATHQLNDCIENNLPPVIKNYGHDMLAGFSEADIAPAWKLACTYKATKHGPSIKKEHPQLQLWNGDVWQNYTLPETKPWKANAMTGDRPATPDVFNLIKAGKARR